MRDNNKNNIYHRAYRKKNRVQIRENNRKYRAAHPELVRKWSRIAARGKLAIPTRPEPAYCEICGRAQKRALCLDHDHTTGLFRGWLCHACNAGLGCLGDSLPFIEAAVRYLKQG
jgi:Recombination endonuclease VII